MAYYSKNLDLFDTPVNSQPGERQVDLEDIIYEKSLYALIKDDNNVGVVDWIDQAASGKVMRIV